MSRIRHATETFVNNLIDSVKKLIESNTSEIGVLSEKDVALEEEINVFSTTHGYINSKEMKDFNACVKNGKYTVYFNGDGVAQHAPPNIWTGDNTFTVDITQQSDTVLVQEICGIYGTNQGRKFYRVNTFGTWTDWKEIATTTKTDILITPRPNRTIIYNNSYKDSMGFVVDVRVKNTDDSDIPVGYDAWFDGLPYIGDVYKPISAICLNASGAYVGECGGYRWGSGVYLYPSVVCKSIAVYDRYGGV